MEITDTHCHIDVQAFEQDRHEVLERCASLGVKRIIVPGIHAQAWENLLSVCDANIGLYPALGLHPVFLDKHRPADLDNLVKFINKYRPLAVGEIGLDYYLTDLDRGEQKKLFEAQLEIAREYSLPVILHARKSHDAIISTLKRIPVCGGVCHAFNGSLQQAAQYIDLGFKLGFGGMITYQGSHKLRRLVVELPIESLVLETDAPDMSGAGHHGERNSPEYLPEYLSILSELRNVDKELIASQTTLNAEAIFNFSWQKEQII